jgi:hypothetical protein
MRTGGPAQTGAALKRIADAFTGEQRRLYGKAFGTFASKLNTMQGSGMAADAAAKRVIGIAEESPAPILAGVGEEAEGILRFVREKSFVEQDALRLQLVGLGADGKPA